MAEAQDPATVWGSVADAWDASVDYVNGHGVEATTAMIDGLAVRPGDRLVELAGGPGTLGALWAELVGPEGSVIVSDLTAEMVEAARRRLSPFDNVSTAQLDLAAIDLPDESADVVACRHGLMFVPAPEGAVAEIHRILAPGGRVGVIVWAGIEHNPWVSTVGMAAMAHGVVSDGPPVGPGQIFSLGDPDRLGGLATAAGFAEVSVSEVSFGFHAPDVEHHLERVASLAGPLSGAFRAATPEQMDAVRQSVTEMAAEYVTADGYHFPGRALVLTARK